MSNQGKDVPADKTASDIEKGQALGELENQKTLLTVIRKMRRISIDQYDSKTYDNIYSIFMQLAVQEKRILLKGFINLFFIVEDKMGDDSLSSKEYNGIGAETILAVKKTLLNTEEHIADNLSQIEIYNKKEMIHLKSRLTIIVVATVALGLVAMLVTAVFLSNDKSETIGVFTEFGKIIAEIFGLS